MYFRFPPQVNDLLQQKDALLADLRAQLLEDYDLLLDNREDLLEERREHIKNASHCVNAMGISVRREIITRFCFRILEEYKTIFQPGGGGLPATSPVSESYASLDHVERRYAWLKRALKDYEDKYMGFFPGAWNVGCALCEHFCHISRQHLVEVLGATHHTTDPELMVRVLRSSIQFENELARKFQEGTDMRTRHISEYLDEEGSPGRHGGHRVEDVNKVENFLLCFLVATILFSLASRLLSKVFRGEFGECFYIFAKM